MEAASVIGGVCDDLFDVRPLSSITCFNDGALVHLGGDLASEHGPKQKEGKGIIWRHIMHSDGIDRDSIWATSAKRFFIFLGASSATVRVGLHI